MPRPGSTVPGHEPIILTGDRADALRIVAALVAVLGYARAALERVSPS